MIAETDVFFIEHNDVPGSYLIIGLWNAEGLDDPAHVAATFRDCVKATEATQLNTFLPDITPNNGVTGFAALEVSHSSIHTWPETGHALVHIFMCGTANLDKAVEVLNEAFCPSILEIKKFLRGPR